MRFHEIEAWTLQVIDRLRANQPLEDARVELKARWPEADRAARRIAGHANAARGAPILWIIGVDEAGEVVGADKGAVASWWAQVKAECVEMFPELVDLNVPVGSQTVVALLFETERAPFVVRNPAGGAIGYEVPWRDGTAIRSARRSELIRILSPLQTLPDVEVLGCTAHAVPETKEEGDTLKWLLWLRTFITPRNGTGLVIPFHRCQVSLEFQDASRLAFDSVRLGTPGGLGTLGGATHYQVALDGPACINLSAEQVSSLRPPVGPALLQVQIRPAGADVPLPLVCELRPVSPGKNDEHFRWAFGETG